MSEARMGYPRLRLDFYDTAVLLSRWEDDGRTTTYPVSVHDVVSACTQIEVGSGLLPPNTLFWKQRGRTLTLGVYVPARRWRVQVAEGDQNRVYQIPLPPLLFVGSGAAYHAFAMRRRPRSAREPLYHAPCPNVHGDGSICQGNAPFPACTPQTMQTALHLFLEGSAFNGHLSSGKSRSEPEDVRRLWAQLERQRRFPLRELIPTPRSVGQLF